MLTLLQDNSCRSQFHAILITKSLDPTPNVSMLQVESLISSMFRTSNIRGKLQDASPIEKYVRLSRYPAASSAIKLVNGP